MATYCTSDVYDFNKNVVIAQTKESFSFGNCAFPYYMIKDTKTNIIKNSLIECIRSSSLHHITMRGDISATKKYELFSFVVDYLSEMSDCGECNRNLSCLLWLIENDVPVYTSSGDHLLVVNSFFLNVYVECGGDVLCTIKYNDTTSVKLSEYIGNAFADLIANPKLRIQERFVKYGIAYVASLNPCDAIYKSFPRFVRLITKRLPEDEMISTIDTIRSLIVDMDLVNLFSPDEVTLELVNKRIQYLKINYSSTWNLYLRRRYDKFIRKMVYRNLHSGKMSYGLLVNFLDVFDDKDIRKALQLYGNNYRIALVPDHVLSYSLGLRISIGFIPHDLIIQKSREYHENPIQYVETISKENSIELKKIARSLYFSSNPEVIIRNKKDTLENKISSYPLDDVVYYLSRDGGVYFYTRPEFEKLKEAPKNFYTREVIPVWTLSMIHAEMLWSTSLPESMPIAELMERITNPPISIPEYCFSVSVLYISHTPTGVVTSAINRDNKKKNPCDLLFNKIDEL